jgi:AcrR family transcriptional regulator
LKARTKGTPKREQTRALIYETALALFQREGYEATTMRRIAEEAGLSAGAAYYHFKSKDDLVLEFYLQSEARLREEIPKIRRRTSDFFERLQAVLEFRLRQFQPHRKFVGVLHQNAIEPGNPLSPFHPDMFALREEAVGVFEGLLELARLKILPELRPHCAHLLWLFQLGVLLFWLHDASPGQTRTRRLIHLSVAILRQLLRLQRLPFARRLTRSVIELLTEFSLKNSAASRLKNASPARP